MTMCLICDINHPSRDLFEDVVKENDVYWMGYILCDPKPTTHKDSSPYDMLISDAMKLNLEGIPVKYNHNRNGISLGEVVAAWHDHKYNNVNGHNFAICFLAHINNASFLRSSANLMMLSECFASLSTFKHDKSIPLEISLCYCGARDGTVGVFLKGSRVKEKALRFGYPDYKRVSASHMLKMSETNVNGFEDAMASLPENEFETIKSQLQLTQSSLDSVCHEYEEAKKMLNLMETWMGDVIGTRLAMEGEGNNEITKKRRRDLEMLRKRGIIDASKTDIESVRELMALCHECYPDDTVSKQLSEAVLKKFDSRFPELEGKVKGTNLLETVDAAFGILRTEMQRREASAIQEKQRKLNKKALELARTQFENIREQTTNNETSQLKDTMSFEAYMKNRGFDPNAMDTTDASAEQQPRKKRKLEETESDIPVKWHDDFLKFANERAKQFDEEKQKYHKLQTEYLQHREQRKAEKEKTFIDLNNNIKQLINCMKNQCTPEVPSPKQEETVNASMSAKPENSRLFDL